MYLAAAHERGRQERHVDAERVVESSSEDDLEQPLPHDEGVCSVLASCVSFVWCVLALSCVSFVRLVLVASVSDESLFFDLTV